LVLDFLDPLGWLPTAESPHIILKDEMAMMGVFRALRYTFQLEIFIVDQVKRHFHAATGLQPTNLHSN
jgi:hypothetical protein